VVRHEVKLTITQGLGYSVEANLRPQTIRRVEGMRDADAHRAWHLVVEHSAMLMTGVIVEMSSGLFFGIPRKLMPELQSATDRQMALVKVDDLGSGLIWNDLDVQISVIGIILEALGEQVIKAAAGRASGMVVTEAKAAAARRNGAKGGRPRKAGARTR
jgi:hypothetical protein